jgi:hypothetical protein
MFSGEQIGECNLRISQTGMIHQAQLNFNAVVALSQERMYFCLVKGKLGVRTRL